MTSARKALEDKFTRLLSPAIDARAPYAKQMIAALIDAALSAPSDEPSQTPLAPEGWQVVPKEPTKEMILAGEESLEDHTEHDWDSGSDGESHNTYTYMRSGHMRAAFEAMLSVAPTPPVLTRDDVLEEAAKVAESWVENNQAEPSGQTKFTISDIRAFVAGACELVAADIRALRSTPAGGIVPGNGVAEDRSCTCHPDDNPPVPCARKYALQECCRSALIQPPETPARPSADTAPEADCEVVRLQAEIDKYRNCFAELTAKAAPYSSGPADDMHKISSYVIPAGPLHRAAGQVEGQWFDGITHLAQAQADAAAYRDALEEIAEHPGVTADDSAHLRAGIARDALKRPDPQPAESAELWAVDGYPTLDPWNRTGEAEMERKSIVAWLRNDDAVAAALHAETGPLNFRRFYATAIERGDHLTPPEPREKP